MSIIRRLLGMPDKLDSLDKKVESLMTNQEIANQLGADIAEDVEVLARISDQFVTANANLKSQLAAAEAAVVAAGVDFEPIRQSAGDLDKLATKLNDVFNPDVISPKPEEVTEVAPAPGVEVPVAAEPSTPAPEGEAPATGADLPVADAAAPADVEAEVAAAEAAAADESAR